MPWVRGYCIYIVLYILYQTSVISVKEGSKEISWCYVFIPTQLIIHFTPLNLPRKPQMIQRYVRSVAVSVRRRENMNSRRAVCAVLPFSKFPCMYVLVSTVLQWDTLIPLLSINKTSTVKSSSNPFCAKNVWSSKKYTLPQTLIPMFVSITLYSGHI